MQNGGDNSTNSRQPFATINPNLESKLIFIMGLLDGASSPNKEILKEQDAFGDLLVENFVDSYLNLTLKSVYILKYIRDYCPSSKFVVKADDDVFLHIPNLQRTLSKPSLPEKLVLGSLICGAKPIQNPYNKYYSPSHMFTGSTYPNYVSGTSYVLSGNIVPGLYEMALKTPLFHMEDIFITGICAKRLGAVLTDDIGFSLVYRPPNPCLFQNATMSHQMTASDMRKLWYLLHTKNAVLGCKPLPADRIRSYNPKNCD